MIPSTFFSRSSSTFIGPGGRRIPVTRPRVRAANGSRELRLASYDLFSSAGIFGQLAIEKMLAGLSSRRYRDGLEPVGSGIAARLAWQLGSAGGCAHYVPKSGRVPHCRPSWIRPARTPDAVSPRRLVHASRS